MARDRSAPAAAVTAALLLALVAAPAPAVAVPNPSEPVLHVSPTETGVPATVATTGSCPATDETGSDPEFPTYHYPGSAQLAFPAAGEESRDVALDSGGEFSESFTLPGTLAPGTYTATLTCPHSPYSTTDTATADETVLPPPPAVEPTLTVNPPSAGVGDAVTASGTCPSSTEVVTVLLEGSVVGRDAVGSAGEFGPVRFSVPDLSPGLHRVSTSCDATADLTVVAPVPASSTSTSPSTPPSSSPTPSSTSASSSASPSSTSASPPASSSSSTTTVAQVAVPDLTGLTEAQARDRLQEAGLVLAHRTGTGRVSRQNPAAGTLTDPASAVRIVLAGDRRPTTGLPPVLIAAVGLLVVAAAITATLLWRGRRWRRRRWLDQHVSARLVEPRPSRQFTTVPTSDAPGVSVRLQVRSASGAQRLEEVDRARAGAHAPGHDDVRAGDRARG